MFTFHIVKFLFAPFFKFLLTLFLFFFYEMNNFCIPFRTSDQWDYVFLVKTIEVYIRRPVSLQTFDYWFIEVPDVFVSVQANIYAAL